jgi:hypothetical protein
LNEKLKIHFLVSYLLEHINWRLNCSGLASSESEESVFPSSSAMLRRSFPINVTAVIRTDSNHCYGHVSNNPVPLPLLFQSFRILTLSVRIYAIKVAIFFRCQVHPPLQRETTAGTLLSPR